MEERQPTVGIFVGGGPAPGINGVIAAATIEARNRAWRVLGLYDGLSWLAEGITTQTRNLRIRDVSRIHGTGGSILRVSRRGNVHEPEIRKRVLAGISRLGIDALISIGGDGTASAAAALAREGDGLRVIHVPKTIDNDLPIPGGFSTFGFQTARHIGVELVEHLMEDAKTTGRWYLVITMGRDAGHLAMGIGKAAGATVTVIPEEFDSDRIGIEDLALPIEGAIIRRLSEGRRDGVVVLAEGLARKIDPATIVDEACVQRDNQGNLRLSDLPLGNVLRSHLNKTLEARGIDINMTTKVIGYELRCAPPIPFDTEYTRELGFAAMRAVRKETPSGVVCRVDGRIQVVPFADMIDPATGRMPIRMVDTQSESYMVASRYQIRLRKSDLDDPERRARLALASGLDEASLVKRFQTIAVKDHWFGEETHVGLRDEGDGTSRA
ncbi:MAG: 6-phosphofructokinase [Planctomycetes bacterium]|nr:6-phosphofructokinase [Planctomycetota bacterium]